MLKRIMLVVLLATGWAGLANAEGAQRGPYEVVADTTKDLVNTIEEAKSYADEDPDRFKGEVRRILDDVVDFQSFARGVMGKYGSRGYYESLSAEEKDHFRDQVMRFTSNFKDGLINTYATGLLGFNGNRIEVLPLADDVDLSGSVAVRQQIFGERVKPYELVYTLRQSGDGEWRLRNVIIEGLNLGRIYQNQFNAAVQQYNGDIDKVIDNWTVTPKAVEEARAES